MSTSDQATAAPPVHVTIAEPLPVAVMRPGPTGSRLLTELVTAALMLLFRAWIVLTALRHFDVDRFGFLDALMFVIAVSALRGINLDYLSWTHTLGRRR